jgi:hypothetical protein
VSALGRRAKLAKTNTVIDTFYRRVYNVGSKPTPTILFRLRKEDLYDASNNRDEWDTLDKNKRLVYKRRAQGRNDTNSVLRKIFTPSVPDKLITTMWKADGRNVVDGTGDEINVKMRNQDNNRLQGDNVVGGRGDRATIFDDPINPVLLFRSNSNPGHTRGPMIIAPSIGHGRRVPPLALKPP